MTNMAARARSSGLSLIEIMVALAIGSLLLLGLVQVFSASRAAYQLSEGMARTQENARFAMDFLQRDLRMVGHLGCVNDQAHFVKAEGDPVNRITTMANAGQPLDFEVSIQGYEATGTGPTDPAVRLGSFTTGWSPSLPASIQTLSPAPLPGSDIVVLRYLNARGTPVLTINTDAIEIPVAGPGTPDGWAALTDDGVANPTVFGMGDCSHVDFFTGTGSPGSISVDAAIASQLGGRYNPHPAGQTVLYRANSIVYYVGNGTSGEPSLWRARANSAGAYGSEELVEGVESLQFLYGLDETDAISSLAPPRGSIDEHATAATLGVNEAQWRRVGLVQVGLLLRSPQPATASQAASSAANPRALGVEFRPASSNDSRYRSTYEATIALRNRLFGN